MFNVKFSMFNSFNMLHSNGKGKPHVIPDW